MTVEGKNKAERFIPQTKRPLNDACGASNGAAHIRAFRARSSQRGVTLIDVSIALLILGLIMVPLMYLYNNQKQREIIAEQRQNFYLIQAAIEQFVERNGRYPLPSSLLETYSNNAGTASMGIELPASTVQQACADIETNGACLAGPSGNGVFMGAVPYNTLGISPEITVDFWGNKLIYAVTDYKTVTATYTPLTEGVIQLFAVDASTGDPVSLAEVVDTDGETAKYNDFDIVLVSTGPSGKGGYTADGILTEPCAEPGNPEYEDRNCSFTGSFMIDENKRIETFSGTYANCPERQDYCNGTRNLIEGPAFYDDFTHEIKRMPTNLQYDFNNNDKSYVVSEAHGIAIGHRLPGSAIDVHGDVRVSPKGTLTTGRLITPNICDGNAICMSPTLLAGQVPSMHCYEKIGAGTGIQPVIGVGGARVVCGAPTDRNGAINNMYNGTGNPNETYRAIILPNSALARNVPICDPGEYVTRIVGGVPQCEAP